MSKKKLPVTSLVNELHGASAFFSSRLEPKPTPKKVESAIQKPTSNSTQKHDTKRETSSENTRENSRKKLRDLPTRDEVQQFTFRLRDEIKIKVQAEVPHRWQKELEDLARELDVKKLELYRFMIGEFLGKVKRKRAA